MIKNRTAILVLLTGLNLLNYVDRMIVAAVLLLHDGPILRPASATAPPAPADPHDI